MSPATDKTGQLLLLSLSVGFVVKAVNNTNKLTNAQIYYRYCPWCVPILLCVWRTGNILASFANKGISWYLFLYRYWGYWQGQNCTLSKTENKNSCFLYADMQVIVRTNLSNYCSKGESQILQEDTKSCLKHEIKTRIMVGYRQSHINWRNTPLPIFANQ